ncbi:TonB-dependent receptor [Niastella caeni]|uniref:TonB-dependent receptor n=1 Tax=Niastella caeni TaxID=2569763 RepID=A0A4S8HZB3_9BACT|nr:TonB-dependent receptor [Niastella caeni]THU40179.1 TonB-dependent receptor [Niastella caeni]
MLRKFSILRKIGQVALFSLLFLWFSFQSFSQQNQVTVHGRVSSDSSALENVTISLKSDGTKATQTDARGLYVITVPSNGVLVFSMVGYEPQEVKVNGQGLINLHLKVKSNDLSDVTVIGFGGTRKKASLVSSITTVNVKDLQVPTGNLTNAIAGKVAGMIAFQQSGEPGNGSDNSTFYIRGLSTFGTGKQEPLILIDGVESSPTDMARLQADDISDFSVLKDAAAASVYGARGANGVVLVNTKMGRQGMPRFFVRSETRASSNARNFAFADNITYMNLANEAATTRNPGTGIVPYTQNKINHTIAGDDPSLYPNNNWIDKLVRKYTVNQNYYTSVNGGTQKATYHIAASYGRDNGILKVDPINNFNSNIRLAKYSLRSNVNLYLAKGTELIVRMYGQFDDYNGPIGGGGNIFGLALKANPVMFPAVYPREKMPYLEHPLFGSAVAIPSGSLNQYLYVNPYAEMVKGYSTYKSSNVQPQIELKQKLDFLTKGLSFRSMAYLRRTSFYSVSRNYNPFYYAAQVNSDGKDYNIISLNDGSAGSVGVAGSEYLGYSETGKDIDSRIWLEGSIDYNRLFRDMHRVGASLISYMSSYETGNGGNLNTSLPKRNHGVSGRFTYGYDDRYLAEFNFGYNGSERFDSRHRYGFFPSGGIGYRISNEQFFDPLKKVIRDLKFRATYGIVGNDQIGAVGDRFFYLSNVNLNDGGYGASFGRDDGAPRYSRPGVSISRYANPNITWERSKQINVGIDLNLFGSFEMIADVFKQNRSHILLNKSNVESAMGLMAVPSANYGKAESRGIDLSLKYEKAFNKSWYANIRGTFTYATNKAVVVDELQYDSDLTHLSAVGHSLKQNWGYIAERLFIDKKEVANSPVQFGDAGLLAGDIKYRDITGDGVVNSDDQVAIGYPTQPEIIYGFGASLRYKRLDLSFYFQGSARSSFFIDPRAMQPFFQTADNGTKYLYQNGLLKVISDDYWSEDNQNPYAFWPRLSPWRVEPNLQRSTWWMRNGNFLRLKSVDMGYNIRKIKSVGIEGGRVYLSATNLFVISNFKLWDVEMGGNGLGYPVQSVYSLGLELNF